MTMVVTMNNIFLAFIWLALRTNLLGLYMNYDKEAKSLTFGRGSEGSQVLVPF